MPKKYRILNPKEIIKILLSNGFYIDRQKGSHMILKNDLLKKTISVPMHNKDLPNGTLHTIIKQSNLDDSWFR